MKPLESAEIAVTTRSSMICAQSACERIAPTWPLDSLIAVNPWWQLRTSPMHVAAARLSVLAGIDCLMPKAHYRQLWQRQIEPEHLQHALAERAQNASQQPNLLDYLNADSHVSTWKNVSEWMDVLQGTGHRMAWGEEIRHQISQFCASHFQASQANVVQNLSAGSEHTLYADWLNGVRLDRGIQILMGEAGLQTHFQQLPDHYSQVLDQALAELDVDEALAVDYFHALLLDINGWASLTAYFDRYAPVSRRSRSVGILPQLLAIRLAWEMVLWRHCHQSHPQRHQRLQNEWSKQMQRHPQSLQERAAQQSSGWDWQRAAELAYAGQLHAALRTAAVVPKVGTPQMQAVFCIDVRSEPMRRALEKQSPGIRTLGFAGFFGLPLSYQPIGSLAAESRLPGLLEPQIQLVEGAPDEQPGEPHRQAARLNRKARLGSLGTFAPSTFSLVESLGLGYAFKLFFDSFFPSARPHAMAAPTGNVCWHLHSDGEPLSAVERAQLAARVLRGMSLTENFAPYVLLVGHGSSSRNNPHAAGLECGACGGHAGDLSARVLAMLLNDAAVRVLLSEQGIHIPGDTRFVPGLHNTITDTITILEHELPPEINQWLNGASAAARRARAASLGLQETSDARLRKQLSRRASDWSQPRPEWGLANNAAFIAAPRCKTQHLNLQGRVFLHEYDWYKDTDFSILESIMTAPMVVAHWINMQYYASVTDHQRYGSGNKILHNVVGGNLGVFEGNGGDLRIGLPLQSVHDGHVWRHEPLRLAVYLAAPARAIANVYTHHEVVRQLVDNQWLHLYRLGDDPEVIEQLREGVWYTVT